MRIFLLLLSLFWAAGLHAQTLNVTNVVRTGLLSTCNNSVPIVTASFSSGSGTSVTNGSLVCTDPCGTTTLLVSISNIKWEQQNAEWIHSVFFPANAGFTVSGISLPAGFITYNAGCTGLCPVGITAGPGFYFDASAGNSCCPGTTANDGNPCNNWGASTLNCSNAFSINFYMTFCNSTLTTPTETFTLTAQSDGGTGCYDINNFTSHTVSFNINVVPCGPVVVPSASAPVRSCAGGSINYTSTLTGPCNNNGTVTWWTAATGGTQVGSGSPFIYDPAGSTCPGGQTLYASCCPNGSTTCLPRTAVTIPGTCTVPTITAVNTAAGSCGAGASITSVSTANTVNPLTYTLQPSGASNSTGVFTNLTQTAYTLTVSDASSCTATSIVSLAPAPLTTFNTPVSNAVSCSGGNDGSLSISANGVAPITYGIIPAATQTLAGNFTGLIAQVYTITATDGNNCTETTTVTISQPASLQVNLSAPPIPCLGANTILSASVSGGTLNYQFQLNGGSLQGNNSYSVSASTYTVTVTDGNNCTASSVLNVAAPTAVGISTSFTPVSCFGGQSTLTVYGSGGTSPYFYGINNGPLQSGNTFSLGAGSYTVTVSDVNNCSTNSVVTITAPSAINLSLSSGTILCNNGTTNITATTGGGSPAYQYQLNNGPLQSSNVFTSGVGTYTITVSDLYACSSSSVITLTQPPFLNISSVFNPIPCNGGTTLLTLSAIGGTGVIQYSLNSGAYQSGNTYNINAGSYTITAQDANNCTASTTILVTDPPVLSVTASSTAILCQGGTSQITATGTGGTGAYQYQLNNGGFQSSNTFNVVAGTYTITILDANNCTSITVTTITEPTLLGLNLSSTAILCNGGQSSITATASGGTTAYQYSLNGAAYQSGNTFTVGVGTYTISTQDANGCTASSTIVLAEPSILNANILTWVDPTCTNPGSATATANGGVIPYNFTWNTLPVQNSALVTGLSAGTYIVTVTDLNGCTDTSLVTLNNPSTPIINSVNTTNATCVPGCDGSQQVLASGGSGPFIYSFDNGNSYQVGNSLNSLCIGTYTVVVKDANDCTVSTLVNIQNPNTPAIHLVTNTNASCVPGCDANSTVAVTGGTPAYQYSSDNGISYQISNQFQSLCIGSFTIVVKDAAGCSVSTVSTINASNGPQIDSVQWINPLCFGDCNGQIAAFTSNGSQPIVYTITPNTPNQISVGQFGNVCAGTYTILATDVNGCTYSTILTLTEPSALQNNLISSQNVSVFGQSNGSAIIGATGGTPGYTYSINPNIGVQSPPGTFTGLPSGNYTVTVIDTIGCSDQVVFTITEPAQINVNVINVIPNPCFGDSLANITASAIGGVPPYIYTINPLLGIQNPNGVFGNLPAGIYTIQVQDLNGALNDTTIQIVEPAQLNITNVLTSEESCIPAADGIIVINATGGSGQLGYTLIPNGLLNLTGIFNGLVSATYSLQVSDQNNCKFDTVAIVEHVPSPALSSSITNPLCFGSSNGQIQTSASSGTPPYITFAITPIAGTQGPAATFTGLAAQSYTLSVNDSKGCVGLDTVQLVNPLLLVLDSVSQQNVSCFGLNDASIQAYHSGGTGVIQFLIQPTGVNNTTGYFNGLSVANYTITATDQQGCSTVTQVLITQPTPLVGAPPQLTMVTCYGGNDGSISVNVNGGTGPHTFTISPGGTSNNNGQFNNLQAGTYSVFITDANNCTDLITNLIITQPAAINFSNVSIQEIACFGDFSGAITVTAIGGTGNLGFSILPASGLQQTSGLFSNLAAGVYTIVATDQSGCTTSIIAQINQNPDIQIDMLTFGEPTCFGDGDGYFFVNAIGGVSPLTYQLNGNSPFVVGEFNNLIAGNYLLSIVDALGCRLDTTRILTQPDSVYYSKLEVNGVLCPGASNGKVIVAGQGGSGDYTYYLKPGILFNKSGYFEGLHEGNYFLIIKDSAGCQFDTTIFISPSNAINSNIIKQDLKCFGAGSEAWAEVKMQGGESPFTYAWSTDPVQTTARVEGLAFGYYFVDIVDANGCELKDTVYINPGPCCEEVFIPNAFSPNGDGINDLFRVTTSAGIELIQFAVYNRWGNRVWITNDFRSGWDGTFLGKDEDMNTYFYIFQYICLTDKQQYTKKGDLLLIR